MSDSEKFSLGYDVAVYIDKAVEELHARYHWATRAHLDPSFTYEIRKIKGRYEYIEVYHPDGKGRGEKSVMDCETAEKFIHEIVWHNDYYILGKNEILSTYQVPYSPRKTDGWWLERYEFNKLATGDYSVYVQAGDRSTGAGRTFFIPPELYKGKAWDGFMDDYQQLVPGKDFGLLKEDLAGDRELMKFLGF